MATTLNKLITDLTAIVPAVVVTTVTTGRLWAKRKQNKAELRAFVPFEWNLYRWTMKRNIMSADMFLEEFNKVATEAEVADNELIGFIADKVKINQQIHISLLSA